MKNKIVEAVFILTGISLLLYFIYEIKQILVYIVISAILTLIGRPIVDAINKLMFKILTLIGRPIVDTINKLPFKISENKLKNNISVIINIISVLITISLLFGVLLLLGTALVPLINEQANSLSLLNIDEVEKNLSLGMDHFNLWLKDLGLGLELEGIVDFFLGDKKMKNIIDFSFIPNFLNSFVGTLGRLSIGILSVFFITFFFLKDKKLLKKGVFGIVPTLENPIGNGMLTEVKDNLLKYLFGLLIQILILFIFYTIILSYVGVKNYFIIALLGALLNLIPYVGPLIGFVLMNLLSITGNITADIYSEIFPMIKAISIGYIIAQMIDVFVSQPIIFSEVSNAHPLEIFLVILISGNLGGILGMIIAVPAYSILRIIVEGFFKDIEISRILKPLSDYIGSLSPQK